MADHAEVAIIGAGPAGLTAAYILGKHGVPVIVLEADPELVGGISRTVSYKGYSFDIGGHRFFSKSKAVEDLWTELLPDDFLVRPRSSRIYYRNKFFSYPLKAFDALSKLGLLESTLCVASYAKAKLLPVKDPPNLEDWVTNQFGSRLFNIFFKTYTEKVWGMSCKEISADWAAQRIRGLSLGTAIIHSLGLGKRSTGTAKTLIESFRYPRKGPGMMWDAAAAKVKAQGGVVEMGHRVEGLHWDETKQEWAVKVVGPHGSRTVTARHVISSAPIRQIVEHTTPVLSDVTRAAGASLRYRDFLIVALMLKDKHIFDDNWIYIHDPTVKVGRIQNFKSWSPEMIPPNSGTLCYGMEYFCFENDGMWARSDADLIDLASREIEQLGLAKKADVLDGCVVRQKKAYPVYDDGYASHVKTIRDELEARFPTLHLVGRNGMHMYNNQDHAMMTAMLTAENIIAKKKVYDVWNVNQDAEYHEAGTAGQESTVTGLRMTPQRVDPGRQKIA
jgi:protoporphyrinogen oxidase